MDDYDSFAKKESYLDKLQNENMTRLNQTMNGFTDPNKLVYLQVKGKNQLFKEIEETQYAQDKKFDMGALHRNEITGEIEKYGEKVTSVRKRGIH